jgi:hypothetical protein
VEINGGIMWKSIEELLKQKGIIDYKQTCKEISNIINSHLSYNEESLPEQTKEIITPKSLFHETENSNKQLILNCNLTDCELIVSSHYDYLKKMLVEGDKHLILFFEKVSEFSSEGLRSLCILNEPIKEAQKINSISLEFFDKIVNKCTDLIAAKCKADKVDKQTKINYLNKIEKETSEVEKQNCNDLLNLIHNKLL